MGILSNVNKPLIIDDCKVLQGYQLQGIALNPNSPMMVPFFDMIYLW